MYILLGILGVTLVGFMVFKINKKYWISWEIASLFYLFFGKDHLCECGHTSKKITKVLFNGKRDGFYKLDTCDYCPECFIGAIINCAVCGQLIYPGHAISFHIPNSEFTPPKTGRYVEFKSQMVSCVRPTCVQLKIGGMFAEWEMPGQVNCKEVLTILAFAEGSHTK